MFVNPGVGSRLRPKWVWYLDLCRRSMDPPKKNIVNGEEVNYPKIQNGLENWKLPKVCG